MNNARNIGFKERIAELFEKEKDKDPTLTQEEFAMKCGATRNQLKGWFSGQGSPSPSMMKNIATVYSVSADWLVGITNDSTPIGTSKYADETFYTRLSFLFEKSNISIDDFAKATGATAANVKEWLSHSGEPDISKLKKIASFFGVTTSWLLGESDIIPSKEAMYSVFINEANSMYLTTEEKKALEIFKSKKESEQHALMIEKLNSLPDDDRKAVEKIIEAFLLKQ